MSQTYTLGRSLPIKTLVNTGVGGEMLLQGNLQAVFDALYVLGIIDPVLKMDWQKKIAAKDKFESVVNEAINIANQYNKTPTELQQKLSKFDKQTLSFLAMEVAKEYADYHWRKTLH